MERKLLSKGLDQETASRYAEVDLTLKRLEQKLKDGSALETGQRGSNKVSAMAEQFAPKQDEKSGGIQKSVSCFKICFVDKIINRVQYFNSENNFLGL